MSINKEDELLTNAERAEIERRKLEMDSQKKLIMPRLYLI